MAGDYTLNQTLERLGYTTRPTGMNRKDIMQGAAVVLPSATAAETWEWLKKT